MESEARLIVLAFGGLIALLSLWGLVLPRRLISMVSGAMDQRWGMAFAVSVRLLMGAAMILAAPVSQFPLAFRIIGWIAIAAAVILLLVGREPVRRMIAWFSGMPDTMVRIWVLFGVAFGVFLVYAVR